MFLPFLIFLFLFLFLLLSIFFYCSRVQTQDCSLDQQRQGNKFDKRDKKKKKEGEDAEDGCNDSRESVGERCCFSLLYFFNFFNSLLLPVLSRLFLSLLPACSSFSSSCSTLCLSLSNSSITCRPLSSFFVRHFLFGISPRLDHPPPPSSDPFTRGEEEEKEGEYEKTCSLLWLLLLLSCSLLVVTCFDF